MARSEKTYYLMVRIHDIVTSFQIGVPNASQVIPIKAINLYNLFSEKDHIKEFLSKTEVVLRITDKDDWKSVIKEGSSYGLYEE